MAHGSWLMAHGSWLVGDYCWLLDGCYNILTRGQPLANLFKIESENKKNMLKFSDFDLFGATRGYPFTGLVTFTYQRCLTKKSKEIRARLKYRLDQWHH